MKTVSQTTVGGAGTERGTFHHLLLSAGLFQFSDATLVLQPDCCTVQVFSITIVDVTEQTATVADVDITATAEVRIGRLINANVTLIHVGQS